MTKHFTDANFEEEVIKASFEKPVLVDFFASWCGPCKMQSPIIDEIAEDMGDVASIGKINTEEEEQTATKYEVMSIPTLLLFRNGKVVESLMGLQSADILKTLIESHV